MKKSNKRVKVDKHLEMALESDAALKKRTMKFWRFEYTVCNFKGNPYMKPMKYIKEGMKWREALFDQVCHEEQARAYFQSLKI